jgi:hypothetical protein
MAAWAVEYLMSTFPEADPVRGLRVPRGEMLRLGEPPCRSPGVWHVL